MNSAMLACQAALFARDLYGRDHPSVHAALERARRALADALHDRGSCTVMLVEGRVVCDGRALPGSRDLAGGLFHRLGALGIEWLRFTRDAGTADLEAMLQRVERAERSPDAWRGHAIRAGFIRALEECAAPGSPLAQGEASAVGISSVELVWRSLSAQRRVEAGVLAAMVADICRAAGPSGGTLLRLAALKSHDEYTFVHTINVAVLSAALARAVGLRPGDVHDVTVAALLHDVGKAAIPHGILNKQGALSEEERALMRRHPVEGAAVLLNAPDLPPIAASVAFEHHIRLDGGGYPSVPAGWRLGLATRIVQVADVFDALRTSRPYRAAMPLADVVTELRRGAGTVHDPEIVEEFLTRVALRTDRERAEIRTDDARAAA